MMEGCVACQPLLQQQHHPDHVCRSFLVHNSGQPALKQCTVVCCNPLLLLLQVLMDDVREGGLLLVQDVISISNSRYLNETAAAAPGPDG
jgi:hypothetical protein